MLKGAYVSAKSFSLILGLMGIDGGDPAPCLRSGRPGCPARVEPVELLLQAQTRGLARVLLGGLGSLVLRP